MEVTLPAQTPAHVRRCVFIAAIGPVQPMIAAARRTRDLWFGSQLLSGIAAEVAEEASVGSAATAPRSRLVFPASCPGSAASALAATQSNKVVFVLHTADAWALARALRERARAALHTAAEEMLATVAAARCDKGVDSARVMNQVDAVLEVYCAWAAWPDGGSYLDAYRRAQALLDARKRLRDFAPTPSSSATPGAGLPLSSLDGAAETVITPGAPSERLRRRFGIDRYEELDALGLVKRVLGRERQFPSMARVALEPWISQWSDDTCARLEAPMARLQGLGLASRNNCRPPVPAHRFPWDAELLLPSRREVARLDNAQIAAASGVTPGEVQKAIADLSSGLAGCFLPQEDSLYVALLVADGDRLGAQLDADGSSYKRHRRLSERLAGFAQGASALAHAHGGICIYTGGDDVLALCAVTGALALARALADDYAARMAGSQVAGLPPLTLSVGIAFGHVLAPFGELRALAGRANALAKKGEDGRGLRNALGVIVQPRRGAAVSSCGAWDLPVLLPGFSAGTGLDQRLIWWEEEFASGGLAGSAPYDLGELARQVPAPALPAEARRLFARRTHGPGRARILAHLHARLGGVGQPLIAEQCRLLQREWYIARWLAQREPGAPPVAATSDPAGDAIAAHAGAPA